MDERLEELQAEIWKIVDDLDCLLQLIDDLERYYEYEYDQKSRQNIKAIGLAVGQVHDRLREIVREEAYQPLDEEITE